jgi:hypothetical protein
MLAYSPGLKRAGVPGNLVVAAVAGLPPFYGALAVGRPTAGLVPWALAAWLHLGRELVKDLGDEAGDRLVGRRTLPIRLGRSRAVRVTWWVCVAFVPWAFLLPSLVGYAGLYYPVAAVAALIVLLARICRDQVEQTSSRARDGDRAGSSKGRWRNAWAWPPPTFGPAPARSSLLAVAVRGHFLAATAGAVEGPRAAAGQSGNKQPAGRAGRFGFAPGVWLSVRRGRPLVPGWIVSTAA